MLFPVYLWLVRSYGAMIVSQDTESRPLESKAAFRCTVKKQPTAVVTLASHNEIRDKFSTLKGSSLG